MPFLTAKKTYLGNARLKTFFSSSADVFSYMGCIELCYGRPFDIGLSEKK